MDYLELDGRRFPTVALICPQVEGQEPPDSEEDRSLGLTACDTVRFIPAENGLLIEVEPMGATRPGLFVVHLRARSCYEYPDSDGTRLWLPQLVSLVDGRLVAGPELSPMVRYREGRDWWGSAEPDWICEHIDRMARLPFTQPPGPEVELVSRSDWAATHDEAVG